MNDKQLYPILKKANIMENNQYEIKQDNTNKSSAKKDEYINFNLYEKVENQEKGVWLFRVSTIPAQKEQTVSILDAVNKMLAKVGMESYYVEGNEKKEAEVKSAIDFSALFN